MPHLVEGDRFPSLRIETIDGPQSLAPRWRDGPLVISFMRHFGCTFCREHLAAYKTPRIWYFTDAFAATDTGKLQKFKLVEAIVKGELITQSSGKEGG